MTGAGRPPQAPSTSLQNQANRTTAARRRELGREALCWFLEGLGRHVPPQYLPAARQALADLAEELEIAAGLARRAA